MEEEREKPSKKCLYCGNYDRYYTKGLHHFERQNRAYVPSITKSSAVTKAASVGKQTVVGIICVAE